MYNACIIESLVHPSCSCIMGCTVLYVCNLIDMVIERPSSYIFTCYSHPACGIHTYRKGYTRVYTVCMYICTVRTIPTQRLESAVYIPHCLNNT